MKIVTIIVMIMASGSFAKWTGNVNVAAGSKEYDKDQWEPAESQGEGGIEVDFRPESWPLNLFIGFSVSSGEIGYYTGSTKIAELETEVSELSLGIRKIWESFPHVRPFIEGGFVSGLLDIKVKNLSTGESRGDEGSGGGIYLGGGVYWTLWDNFNIGLYLKGSTPETEYELFDNDGNIIKEKIDIGGGHGGVLIGFHW